MFESKGIWVRDRKKVRKKVMLANRLHLIRDSIGARLRRLYCVNPVVYGRGAVSYKTGGSQRLAGSFTFLRFS